MKGFNFKFPDFIEKTALTNAEQWAFMVKFHERLTAYGYNTKLKLSELNGRKQLTVDMAGISFDAFLNVVTNEIGREKEIKIDNLGHSASWNKLTLEEIQQHYPEQEDRLSKAIDLSIEDWKGRALRSQCVKDFSLEARLFMARQEGFNIHNVFFHETERKFASNIINNGFDISIVENRSMDFQLPDGAFLKPTMESIGVAERPRQIPFFMKDIPILEFNDRDEFDAFTQKIEGVSQVQIEIKKANSYYDSLLEELEHKSGPYDLARSKSILEEWRQVVSEKSAESRNLISAHLLKNEQPAILIKKDKGTFDRVVQSLVVLEPSLLSHSNILSLTPPTVEDVRISLEEEKESPQEIKVENKVRDDYPRMNTRSAMRY